MWVSSTTYTHSTEYSAPLSIHSVRVEKFITWGHHVDSNCSLVDIDHSVSTSTTSTVLLWRIFPLCAVYGVRSTELVETQRLLKNVVSRCHRMSEAHGALHRPRRMRRSHFSRGGITDRWWTHKSRACIADAQEPRRDPRLYVYCTDSTPYSV